MGRIRGVEYELAIQEERMFFQGPGFLVSIGAEGGRDELQTKSADPAAELNLMHLAIMDELRKGLPPASNWATPQG